MTTWNQMAIDNLAAAKLLKEADRVRSCLNRAYYSAYSAAIGRLRESGVDTSHAGRPNPGHEQLLALVLNNLDPGAFDRRVRRELATRLLTLRRFREAADYDPDSSLEQPEALIALQEASRFHQALAKGRIA